MFGDIANKIVQSHGEHLSALKLAVVGSVREASLIKAIEINYSREKIEKLALELKEAKMSIYKMEYSNSTTLPPSAFQRARDALSCQLKTVRDIIENYEGFTNT